MKLWGFIAAILLALGGAGYWGYQHYFNQEIVAEDVHVSYTTTISEETIKAKYYPAFDRLRTEANSRLDQLAANGLAEYRQSKITGSPSVQELVSKYSSAARKLEDAVDATFFQLLGQMKSDLHQAGLPTDLVAVTEKEYKASIQQKKAELMAKALNR